MLGFQQTHKNQQTSSTDDGYHEIHFQEMPHALGQFGGDFGGWDRSEGHNGFSKRVLSPAVTEGWDISKTFRQMMCPNCVATMILGNVLMVCT